MDTTLPPLAEGNWGESSDSEKAATSLMTRLGIIEGEALTYLEQHETTSLRQLIRDLEWPSSLVMMAVGALVRSKLVRATQLELEIVLEPVRSRTVAI